MKRVLVVDDEQPVVDYIVRIIERELAGDYLVAGTASSGRETLEKIPHVLPDIVVLDVRMPGLSGLDTIRELHRRGSAAAFVLSTAYERFDIAREALELGVTGYLLKPVSKEALAQALRAASEQLDRAEGKLRDFDHKERHHQVKGLAAEAFFLGLMMGKAGQWSELSTLGLAKPWGLVGVAVFLQNPQANLAALETVLQYKSVALCGPVISNRCLIYLPLGSAGEAFDAERTLTTTLHSQMAEAFDQGQLKVAFADVRPFSELGPSWAEALGRLTKTASTPRSVSRISFEEEADFHDALVQGDPDRMKAAFEALLSAFEGAEAVSVEDRYRIIALLGSTMVRLASLQSLDERTVHRAMDFDDLRQAADGREFCLLARTRLPAIMGALTLARRWSPEVSLAVDHLRAHYSEALTLDSVAEVVGVSPKRLSRQFTQDLGRGFSDYLIDLRIENAKLLLALPGATIKQVSKDCGYPDPNYFARLFKKVTGTTPSEFSSSG